jgi:hypothetical protein
MAIRAPRVCAPRWSCLRRRLRRAVGACDGPACRFAHSAPARSCKTPPAADVPGAAGALTQADSGTFCLALGQQIDVFLTSPEGQKPGVPRWAPIATSDARVLTPRSSGILTAPVGVTPGIFEALTRGTVQLTSTIPGGTRSWHVAVLVR